jgi:hypothetical protein
MGRNRLFVPQDTLDVWVADHKAAVTGTELVAAQKCFDACEPGDTFDLKPAVLFLQDVAESGDPHKLLGRVKDQTQLTALGAEHYMGSVVLGDSAYDVKDGFVAAPRPRAAKAADDIDAAVGAAAGEKAAQTDEALLTKFLLENL